MQNTLHKNTKKNREIIEEKVVCRPRMTPQTVLGRALTDGQEQGREPYRPTWVLLYSLLFLAHL